MPEMKRSGIEWIGDIPEHWETMKLKFACSIITDFTASGSFADLAANVEYLDTEDFAMLVRTADLSAKREVGRVYVNEHAYNYLHNSNLFGGEIILPNIGSVGEVYYYKPLYKNATLAPNAIMLRPKHNAKYLYYVFYTNQGEDALKNLSNATTQAKFNKTQLRRMKVVVPSISEQDAIANFLDEKCGMIDSLTADIQSQIDTLEEYKKSVITEAVTKGLNHNVEMKDSLIPWINDVPIHWSILPVYCCFGERNNKNRLGMEQNLLSLSYGRIVRKDINTNEGLLPASFNTYNIVEAGDIIIRPTDLQNDKRSLRTGYVSEKGIITSAYIALKAITDVNSRYMHYLLHAYDVMKVFYNMGNGVRQGLNFDEFKKLLILNPPKGEQDSIVDYLDAKCAEIDSIISSKKEQLSTLAEYKKSLIYEYVTGKKEVAAA